MRSPLVCFVPILLFAFVGAAIARPPTPRPLYGYADKTGRVVVAPIYSAVTLSFDGDCVVVASGSKGGFLNLRNGAATGLIFDGVATDEVWGTPFGNGPEAVYLGGKWGYATQDGKVVIPPQFDRAWRFTSDGVATIQIGTRSGFVDREGRVTMLDEDQKLYNFQNGLASVDIDDRYGLIDLHGTFVVPPRFGAINGFASNGLAVASEDYLPSWKSGQTLAHFGFIDRTGAFKIPPIYIDAVGFEEPRLDIDRTAPPGLSRVTILAPDGNRQALFIDASGRTVITLPANLSPSHVGLNGMILVKEQGGRKWGFANSRGELVIPIQFESASGFRPDGLAEVALDGRSGTITADGTFTPMAAPEGTEAAIPDKDGVARIRQGKISKGVDRSGNPVAEASGVGLLPFSTGDYVAFRVEPQPIVYPVRHYGQWSLERTIFAPARPWPIGVLPLTGRVKLSRTSPDGMVAWSIETTGQTLQLNTAIDHQRNDFSNFNTLPDSADLVMAQLRNQLFGAGEMGFTITSSDASERSEQTQGMKTFLSHRDDYARELDDSMPEFTKAWAAMRADIIDQFDALSGPDTCMPPTCLH